MDKLYVLIKEQFPEFVQADYPKFVEFVQAYYKWLEDYLPKDIKQIVDIDNTPDEYLDYFIKQLDVYGLLSDTTPYDKKYIRNIKELYTSKGTEQGLLFLLRAVYNSDVLIDHPVQYILKPSDARWVQEKFITLRTFLGTLDTLSQWDFSYDCRCAGRNQPISVTRTEVLDKETIRLYFQNQSSTILFVGQKINIYDSFGALMYVGEIVLSPAKIEVIDGGADWQLGQVIVWPGTKQDTIVRIAAIDELGSIKRIEAINIGYEHANGETYITSPYPVKPITPSILVSEEQISFDPPAFQFTVDITEEMDGVTDDVKGYVGGTRFNPYFLENFQEEVYSGSLVFNRKTFVTPTEVGETNVSLETWSNSRASLRYTFDAVATLSGKWLDESSHLSTDSIRLQDSFFYQQYSYVIESDVNPSVYKDLASAFHIAGAKMFTQFNATSRFDLESSVMVTFPFVTLDVLDVVIPSDTYNTEAIKLRASEVVLSDEENKLFQKLSLPDEEVLAEESSFKDFTKFRADASDIGDGITSKSFVKLSEDSTTNTDAVAKTLEITKATDTVTPLDTPISKVSTKLTADATLGSTDAVSKTPSIFKVDSSTATESITSKGFTKSTFDTATGTENLAKSFSMLASPDTVTPQDQFFKGTTVEAEDTTSVTDAISRKTFAKHAADSTSTSDNTTKTTAKYVIDGTLVQDITSKRSTKKLLTSVDAVSLDTSDKDVDEYFLSSEEYNVTSDRYAQVTVTATIPE